MRLPKRIRSLSALAFFSACVSARAGDWVPARDHGAYIENIQYGLEPYNEWGNLALKLRVTLQGTGEFSLVDSYYITPEFMGSLYQSLVQAKKDSLPVMLLAEPEERTFSKVLIGNVDPEFPVAMRAPAGADRNVPGPRNGFDLLGRAQSPASARVPLMARPVPAR